MKLPLSRIAEFLAAPGHYDPQAQAQGYSIDSRTVQAGELFFAVKGDRFDGHDFVESALSRGAIAAVVRKDKTQNKKEDRKRGNVGTGDSPVQPGQAPPVLIAVDDTLVALQTLAAAVRKLWGKTFNMLFFFF